MFVVVSTTLNEIAEFCTWFEAECCAEFYAGFYAGFYANTEIIIVIVIAKFYAEFYADAEVATRLRVSNENFNEIATRLRVFNENSNEILNKFAIIMFDAITTTSDTIAVAVADAVTVPVVEFWRDRRSRLRDN